MHNPLDYSHRPHVNSLFDCDCRRRRRREHYHCRLLLLQEFGVIGFPFNQCLVDSILLRLETCL